MILDPLPVDGDVALEEVKARVADQIADAIILHVHTVDFPVGVRQDAFGQVMADEAVDAEDQDSFHRGQEFQGPESE